MTSTFRALPALLTASAVALALSGCAAPSPTTDAARLSIVASTNVYGDIAASIAGDLASVTSIIGSAAHDPHSYEASAQDQLAIANADLVIANGGGYDPFMGVLIEGSGTTAAVITVVELLGLDDDHDDDGHGDDDHGDDDHGDDDHGHLDGVNEHLWYDVHAMEDLAAAIAEQLILIDTGNAAVYRANLDAFEDEIEALEDEIERLAEALGGGTVVATEPVPAYLLAALGFDDRTPPAFAEAIEEGSDVPPLALQRTLALLDSGDVRLLAYNEQTASPETERVRQAAEEAGIPVVSFAETLPEGEDYVSWMRANLQAVATALDAA